jgi:hypothetical protein
MSIKKNLIIKMSKKKESNNEYITKDDFLILNNHVSLKYIKLMFKINHINKKEFIKNIHKIIYEKSADDFLFQRNGAATFCSFTRDGSKKVENVNICDMRSLVNNYNKNVKLYKDHLLELSMDNDIYKLYIINVYVKELCKNIDVIRYILHILYNHNILCSKCILDWYKNEYVETLDNVACEGVNKVVKSGLLKDFINWLESV